MTLFGTTLDPMQVFSLIFLLGALAVFSLGLQGERGWAKWFRQWEADRKARKDAEDGVQPPDGGKGPGKGPWG